VVRPRGVRSGPLARRAEHADEAALVEHLRQPGALLGQEAGVLLVALPVLQVDFLVRDIPVAADHELAAGLLVFAYQIVQPRAEYVQEAVLGLRPLVAAGTGGQGGADHRPVLPAGAADAAFGVELFAVHAGGDALGCIAQVHAHAAVALLD